MDCSYEAGYKAYLWYLDLTGQSPKTFEEWMKLRDSVPKKDKAKEFLSSGSEEPLGF
jgi:hypothetical protein